jgi:gluconolactonase
MERFVRLALLDPGVIFNNSMIHPNTIPLLFTFIAIASLPALAASPDSSSTAPASSATAPDSPATAPAARFSELVAPDAGVKKLASGMQFVEGPVWFDGNAPLATSHPAGAGFLIFSDIPANRLLRWDAKEGVSVFRDDSHGANGNTRDRRGRLITCEQTTRRVTRTDRNGKVVVLADLFLLSKKFNSPNDVVVKSDGTVWFTDPTYGLPKGEQSEIGARYVFCLVPDVQLEGNRRMLRMVSSDDDFDQPNGICFSPDESKLYVADSGRPHHIMVYDVQPVAPEKISLIPWRLKSGREFCVIDRGVPDGIRCDEHGNIWSSAGDGVEVFAPDGTKLGNIAVPETPANLCFGGSDGQMLFITARTSLYAIHTNVKGAPQPSPQP